MGTRDENGVKEDECGEAEVFECGVVGRYMGIYVKKRYRLLSPEGMRIQSSLFASTWFAPIDVSRRFTAKTSPMSCHQNAYIFLYGQITRT
jgi:hypothetical protein